MPTLCCATRNQPSDLNNIARVAKAGSGEMAGRTAKAYPTYCFCSNDEGRLPSRFCAGIILIGALVGAQPAAGLTIDQARENCRATVGRPIVQSCMRSGGGNIEACRAKASPKVHACVQAA